MHPTRAGEWGGGPVCVREDCVEGEEGRELRSEQKGELAGKRRYLDERLAVLRAVVIGTEAGPMRVKEETKRRCTKVKRVKSKLRYTVLRAEDLMLRGEGG